MKYYTIFTLIFFLIYSNGATPIPGGDYDDASRKEKQIVTDSPPSRPLTPTPEHDPAVPLPGRTGLYTDSRNSIVTLFYGDDKVPMHMGHLERNQHEFPHNRNPMALSNNDENRSHALYGIPLGDEHPVTGDRRVRDEKIINMLSNPHHSTSTTVEYLPMPESSGYISIR